MKSVTSQKIHAPVSVIWEILHQPGNMPAWNPKCVASEHLNEPEAGQRFSVTYQMNRGPIDTLAELAEFDKERRIRFRYFLEGSIGNSMVDEIFEMTAVGADTELFHIVDFSRTKFPWWLKLLLGLMDRVGKKSGESSMDRIASLSEEKTS